MTSKMGYLYNNIPPNTPENAETLADRVVDSMSLEELKAAYKHQLLIIYEHDDTDYRNDWAVHFGGNPRTVM